MRCLCQLVALFWGDRMRTMCLFFACVCYHNVKKVDTPYCS